MWLLFASIAVLSSTIIATIFRVSAVKTSNPRAFSFVLNSYILLLALIILFITGIGDVKLDSYLTFLLVLSTLGYGIFQRYQFLARKHLESSITQTIMTPGSIAGYLLAIVWLNESPKAVQVAGYVLILLSTLLIVFNRRRKLELNKYALLALLISVALNLSVVVNRRVAPSFENILAYVVIILFVQVLFTYLPSVSRKAVKKELSSQNTFLILLSVLNLVAIFSSFQALKLAPATYVTPVLASNVVFIAIAGILFLKEKERIGTKLIAASIASLGLFLVSR